MNDRRRVLFLGVRGNCSWSKLPLIGAVGRPSKRRSVASCDVLLDCPVDTGAKDDKASTECPKIRLLMGRTRSTSIEDAILHRELFLSQTHSSCTWSMEFRAFLPSARLQVDWGEVSGVEAREDGPVCMRNAEKDGVNGGSEGASELYRLADVVGVVGGEK